MVKHYCDYCGKEIESCNVDRRSLSFELDWRKYEFCSSLCVKSFTEDHKEEIEKLNKEKEENRLKEMEGKIEYLIKISSELKAKVSELDRREKERLVHIPSKGPY